MINSALFLPHLVSKTDSSSDESIHLSWQSTGDGAHQSTDNTHIPYPSILSELSLPSGCAPCLSSSLTSLKDLHPAVSVAPLTLVGAQRLALYKALVLDAKVETEVERHCRLWYNAVLETTGVPFYSWSIIETHDPTAQSSLLITSIPITPDISIIKAGHCPLAVSETKAASFNGITCNVFWYKETSLQRHFRNQQIGASF